MEDGRPVSNMTRFTKIIEEDIVPLLQEYCYEDYTTLAAVLGEGLVDQRRQRIRYEFFEPDQRDNLIQNLLAPSPEITTSPQIVEQEEYAEENGDEEE
jgi:5-methylcytosine-specific restriction protein B